MYLVALYFYEALVCENLCQATMYNDFHEKYKQSYIYKLELV